MISTAEHNARGAANRITAMAERDNPLDRKPPRPWKAIRAKKVRCWLAENGEPMIQLDKGSPMSATIGEWSLWLLLCEAKEMLP